MKPVTIDTDPGTDDAITIAMALSSPDLEVLGVTTVGGNARRLWVALLPRGSGSCHRCRFSLTAPKAPVTLNVDLLSRVFGDTPAPWLNR